MSRKFLWIGSLLVLLSVLVPTASVVAVSSGGFGGRPANPDPSNPRSESIFIYTIEGGESKEDQVLITNNSDETAAISVYAVDGVTTNTGAYTCKQKSEDRSGIGKWLVLAEETITLGPNEKKLVDFVLTMPEGADVGEHNGCIVFESADDPGEVVSGGAVRLRTRSAVRVAATIPGELHRNIEINSFVVTSLGAGMQSYELTLQNNGNVSADVDTDVTLTNLMGEVVYRNGGGFPVFSGQKLEINFKNEERPFWGGWFYAQAKISYDQRAGTFGTTNTTELLTKEAEKIRIFIMPSPTALLIMTVPVVLVIALLITIIVRRQMRRRANKQWNTYIVQQGDTIETIAKEHGVAWKKLASINKIKAPYTLEKGQKLKAPAIDKPIAEKSTTTTKKAKVAAKKATPQASKKKTAAKKKD